MGNPCTQRGTLRSNDMVGMYMVCTQHSFGYKFMKGFRESSYMRETQRITYSIIAHVHSSYQYRHYGTQKHDDTIFCALLIQLYVSSH